MPLYRAGISSKAEVENFQGYVVNVKDFIKVADVDEIPPGTGKVVTILGREVGLFNLEGQFRAIDNVCPHTYRPIGVVDFDGKIVTCLWHGLSFDVEDGRCLQTTEYCVDTYPVRVEDGQVMVSLGR